MFGETVRSCRREQGLSQEELAVRAEIDVKTVHMIEAGRRTPRMSTVRRLADALQLTGAARDLFCAGAPGRPVAATTGRASRPEPAQLPPDVYGFVGRHVELARLDVLTASSGPSDLWQTDGDETNEAVATDHLGDSHHAAGRPAQAREIWRRAIAILDRLSHADADRIRAKVAVADDTDRSNDADHAR